MNVALKSAILALALCIGLSGCGEPKYAAAKLTMDETPGVVYRFSAADATSASPVFIDIEGREIAPSDRPIRTKLIRLWVAEHAPKDSIMRGWASAECGLERPGEFSGCDIFSTKVTSTGEEIDYFFYAGNWPFRE
jgi:hypothetical protein